MRYVLANWKMHTTVDEAVALFRTVQQALGERTRGGTPLPVPIVCPPFVSLAPIRAVADERLVRLGAQNCHWEQEGPYTGEISPVMLRGLVEHVLVGHSERRATGETDDQVARKVAAALDAGLEPVLFVGEDEPGDDARSQAEQRLVRGLSRVDLRRHRVLIVYEPAWAIGAERPADPEHVGGTVEHLKDRLRRLGARRPEVVYGGSVTEETIDQFTALDVLDGVGATRAALDAEEFVAMVDRVASAGVRRDHPDGG